jgi:hypothetical protein
MYTIKPGHLDDEQREILRSVALAYRRVMRAPYEPAATRAEVSRGIKNVRLKRWPRRPQSIDG